MKGHGKTGPQNYTLQEAKESFASPDYLFYGKSHIVNQLYHKNGCKKPFLFAFNTSTTQRLF